MATYRTILTSETDNNSPVTTTLMSALALNPVAITEGATGAPRNVLKSLERVEAGGNIRSRIANAQQIADPNVFYVMHEFNFIQIGTVRCVINITAVAENTRVTRVRNGTSTIVSASTAGNTSADISVEPGDKIELEASTSSSGTIEVDAQFRTNATNLWPGSAARVENNDV